MAFLGQFRGDLRSEWEAKNPVIHDREFILVKEDPDGPWTAYKTGDGVHTFTELPYGSNISVLQVIGDSETATMSQKGITTALNNSAAGTLNHFVTLTEAEYEALVTAGTVNPNYFYFTTES